MKSKKVVVCQFSGHTFDAASEYGEIVPLLDEKLSPFNVDSIWQRVRERLDELKVSQRDFLLLCGQTIVNAVAFNEWISRFGKIELLIFDARSSAYVHRTVMGK